MSAHTPGPWRWEINRSAKILHLVGGRPKYDLTVMDFSRWGMSRAVANLRDTSEAGMNIMYRLPDRTDWVAPFPGREHHADWCASVIHPDMRLIAAAPDLLDALQGILRWVPVYPKSADIIVGGREAYNTALAQARDAIALATGEKS
jgi:hypothetical protein